MKNIQVIQWVLVSFVLAVGLISCDNDGALQDEESPKIELVSPTMDNMYANGDTMVIKANITDNDELHEIAANITNTTTDEVVWEVETHSHLDIFILEESYVIDVEGTHNNFVLEIEVSDHNANVGTETFNFHVM